MKKLFMMLGVIALISSAGISLAAQPMAVIPMKDSQQFIDFQYGGMPTADKCAGAAKDVQCCKIGNENPWAYAVKDFVTGEQTFSYIFLAEPSCGCVTGFAPNKIRIAINVDPEDVPVTMVAYATFEETNIDDAGKEVPGPVICTSPTYEATITEPGGYVCEIPMNTDCSCSYWDYNYALSMHLTNRLEKPIDLVTDANPMGGKSWVDEGTGWEDLAMYQFPGELKMTTKIDCCSEPVADDRPSWGSLKALFR